MSEKRLRTLFLPLEKQITSRQDFKNGLFLNAVRGQWFEVFKDTEWSVFQPNYSLYKHFECLPQEKRFYDPGDMQNFGTFDLICILATKDKSETRFYIAHGLQMLGRDGVLLIAAENKAGGKALSDDLKTLGIPFIAESKHKARVCLIEKTGTFDQNTISQLSSWLDEGRFKAVCDGQYLSCPGIYGWNKVDRGSNMLAAHLPLNLTGCGADFGCGYGFLSIAALENNPAIREMHCYDSDYRAILAAQKNIGRIDNDQRPVHYHWTDLVQAGSVDKESFDWIVMNPPFHTGHDTDIDLGLKFIKTAALALKSGGWLFMVANQNLPYERVLETAFQRWEKIIEKDGFKILFAEQ